ncbi:MAG: 50S ribosomal protein L17 [Patescibacteria group bacterium]|nr:MAG: 50S ribosomal protein L17 [Patescibacteria group bacterium]
MRHRVKKIKFSFGKDANKMLMRKLTVNFFRSGYLETTLAKAKVLKSHLEKLVSKAKDKTKTNEKVLLKYLGNQKLVKDLFNKVPHSFKGINGGYVKITKLDYRDGDGSLMAKLEWAHPIIEDNNKNKLKVLPKTADLKKIKEKNEKAN